MESKNKLANLTWYLKQGWPILPLNGKIPLTEHGFKEASIDPAIVKPWHEKHPDANWGLRTGSKAAGGAGIVVIDIDKDSGGFDTWDMLREENSGLIETVTVRTGRGGQHLYFKYPDGHDIHSGNGVLGPGIDIKANGGYVVCPPSVTVDRYTFELSPANISMMDLPEWILNKLDGHKSPAPIETPQTPPPEDAANMLRSAISAVNALKKERAENYEQWLEVGMSLFSLGNDGLLEWDNWSKQSAKYERGVCAQKWSTFTPAQMDAHKISLASLIAWAEEDHAAPFIRLCPKDARPHDYKDALIAHGYEFKLNDMNDEVFVNGRRMTDFFWSKIMNGLREYKYKAENYAIDAMNELALDHTFHPVKDYLTSLTWHGDDYIKALSDHFADKDDIFPILIRKWLLGAVGRILGPRPGQQHPMLVLDGPQGIGKSRFVWWLGTPLPAFYTQSAINTDDKDFQIRLCSTFVWEVEELGATFRKSDLESLKSFLSREIVKVRVPYGKRDIVKPATASFIGTLNNSGGFLNDPTGNRRFRTCTITYIDWDYDKLIDINQVWAQAVALFQAGETYELDVDTQRRIVEISERYEVDDPIAFDVLDSFNVDPYAIDQSTPTATIIHRLRGHGSIIGGSDQQIANRIGNVLTKFGCESGRQHVNGHQVRVWRGVWLKV